MGVCTACGGAGQQASGQYDPCYSCGGSGHGSHTDVACMSCNGSGRSSTERYDSCWSCHGAGHVADPTPTYTPSPKPKTKTASNSKTATVAKSSGSLSQNIAQVAVVLTIIVLVIASDDLKGGEFIVAGLGAFFASFVGLLILYYVAVAAIELLKVALKIAAVGLVILVVIGIFSETKAATVESASADSTVVLP